MIVARGAVVSWLLAIALAHADTVLPPEERLTPVALDEGKVPARGSRGEGDEVDECHELDEVKSVGAIQLATLFECSAESATEYRLAIRVAHHRYLSEPLVSADRNGGLNAEIAGHSLTDERGRLALRLTVSTYNRGERNSRGERNGETTDEDFLVVCSVGPSRVPSCTPTIQLSGSETFHPYASERRKEKTNEWRINAHISRDAILLDAPARTRKRLEERSRALLGKHPLLFP